MFDRARFRGPSPGGRRLALERKFKLNVSAYGGAASILTLTAWGADLLPWSGACAKRGPHKCEGRDGCRVEWIYAAIWNQTAQGRASRLFEAAQRHADRVLRRVYGIEGPYPRQIGNVGKVLQERGVYHFHWLLPQGSELERIWSREVRRYVEHAVKRERALTVGERWAAVEREYMTGEITQGVYGFGFSHPGRRQRSSEQAARYMARNAAGYVAGNAGRHYVSTRLTRLTGATMRTLRDLNYLYVRRKAIERGELLDEVIPFYWDEERRAVALRVQGLLEVAPARGP